MFFGDIINLLVQILLHLGGWNHHPGDGQVFFWSSKRLERKDTFFIFFRSNINKWVHLETAVSHQVISYSDEWILPGCLLATKTLRPEDKVQSHQCKNEIKGAWWDMVQNSSNGWSFVWWSCYRQNTACSGECVDDITFPAGTSSHQENQQHQYNHNKD